MTMHTQITSKLAALIVALTLNTMIVAGVATVFNMQIQHRSAEAQSNVSAPALHAVA
jgi:hypothetical protein